MRLFIAEKPSMGKIIASFLPAPHKSYEGYIETGGGTVTWCIGHLMEQMPPDAYDPKYKGFPWKYEDLPILPKEWKIQVSEGKQKQFNIVKGLIKQCSEVIHGGDPGREGQGIISEVLEYVGNKKPVLRILLNSLDRATVLKALSSMVDNTAFDPLYQAALGRSRSDWLIGMNMTRAYTILGKRQGYQGVLSVGRVQTPTVAIVVRRDREIESFIPKSYWSIQGTFVDPAQPDLPFETTWVPPGISLEHLEKLQQDPEGETEEDPDEESDSEHTSTTPIPSWMDDHHRIIDEKKAEQIVQDVRTAGTGVVTQYKNNPAEEQPPLPYELTELQAALNSKYGYTATQVLEACQTLYEKGHTSYPRTDCSYLPMNLFPETSLVLKAIAAGAPQFSNFVTHAQPTLQSRAWNDAKLGEHYAIIPTPSAPNWGGLTSVEQAVYETVALQFLAQFYPNCKVDKAKIEISIAQWRFIGRGRVVKNPGWRVLFGGGGGKVTEPTLPVVATGQMLQCTKVQSNAKRTAPPPYYNEGTLLKAMKHVDRLVDDPVEKKKLKAIDGIGRSATRAAILETVKKRGFLVLQGKKLVSSQTARNLIDALPPQLTDPGLTARWENVLDAVAQGKLPLSVLISKQEDWVRKLITTASTITMAAAPPSDAQTSPSSSKRPLRKTTTGATKKTGGAGSTTKSGTPCPQCGVGSMVEREVKQGTHAGKKFKGCTNYPACKYSEWPK